MTDDLMDARLRAAGERWRNAEAADVPAERGERIEIVHTPPRRTRWIAAASAAVIAGALLVGGIVFANNRGSVGGHAASPASRTPLVGTRWQLIAFAGRDGASHAADPRAFLEISSGDRFSGSDGCNGLSGRLTVGSASIDFRQAATTLVRCKGATASHVTAVLSGAVRYEISGARLTLTKPGVGGLTYRAATPGVAQLIGASWMLTSTQITQDGPNTSSGTAHSAVSVSVVSFDGDGRFTVRHRCYTDTGQAALAEGSAELSHVTLKWAVPCASNAETRAGQRENDFVDAVMTGHVTWSIERGLLTVAKANGHAAVFTSK
jgi:heat shock protein HslJ